MTFYSKLAATALRLITDKGSAWVLTRVTKGAYDPSALTTSGDTTETETFQAVLSEYSERMIDGQLIRHGDKRLMIAAGTLTPQIGDTMANGGETWRVEHVETVKPADTVLYHEARVRR